MQAFDRLVALNNGSNDDEIGVYLSSSFHPRPRIETSNALLGEITPATTLSQDSVFGLAFAWTASSLKICINGNYVFSISGSYSLPTVTDLRMGRSTSSDAPGGGVERVVYYRNVVGDADLQAIATRT